jgi:hypothetical protein
VNIAEFDVVEACVCDLLCGTQPAQQVSHVPGTGQVYVRYRELLRPVPGTCWRGDGQGGARIHGSNAAATSPARAGRRFVVVSCRGPCRGRAGEAMARTEAG